MKRLRSSDDLDSYGKENPNPNPNPNPNRLSLSSSSSHRGFHNKFDTVRKGLVPASPSGSAAASGGRYDGDRSAVEDDREGARMVRKRSEHDFEGFDRRKGFDRYRDGGGGGGGRGESRGYDRSLMHRSESFCGPRREFPKGFRSERDRSRREGSAVSSWRRFGGGNKEFDDGGGSRTRLVEERGKGIRDVRSPTWSRDSGSEQSRVRSPPLPARGLRDGKSMSVSVSKSKSKSPTWSKDSVGSEQSKCVEVKKTSEEEEEEEEGVQVQSGSSSEMEEGEFEPEPKSEAGGKSESVPEGGGEKEEEVKVHGESEDMDIVVKDQDELSSKEEMDERNEKGVREVKDVDGEVDGLPKHESNSAKEKVGRGSDIKTESHNEGGKREEDCSRGGGEGKDEATQRHLVEEKLLQSDSERRENKGIDLEAELEGVEETGMDNERTEDGAVEEDMTKATESLAQSFKDKGKSVVVTPTNVVDSAADDGGWIEREPGDLMARKESDIELEGPSTRGFELFSSSPVRRQGKADRSAASSMRKDEKLTLEPLDLSLSLPNVLLPIGAAPGSPGQARSVQSLTNTFRTNSDGFTASVSFSGSQSFYHNPSCSLTQNSLDNFEQSVKSRPLFGGIDWQALSQNEPKNNSKEVPLYQRILLNGNGSQSHQQSQPASNGQCGQGQHPRGPEGSSSKMANGLERQLSFHKQLSGGGHSRHHHDDVRSPSHSVGSHDIGSSYSFERKRLMREKSSGSLYRTSSSKMDQEQSPFGGVEVVETVIGRIVTEPIPLMARKFHEMNGQSLACLKESIRETMLNTDKHRQMSLLKKALVNRPELNLEMLLKSHRVQLEILVALKTGLPDFLQQDMGVSSSDLAEIFLNSRCRNLACRSPVPVDECDCKVCSQKTGFCSTCMCLVCSKFDMASNTCSWVGCDVCLHWCHADCGLRESYIRNGRSATGSQGASEMQFHCVACDHPSEMFGFVKEVFQNFAKEWTAETLSKELEYVKRIFAASKDLRGRRLHEIAGQMLTRLTNKSDLPGVYSHIMAFLNGNEIYLLKQEFSHCCLMILEILLTD